MATGRSSWAARMARAAVRRGWTRFMDRVGSRLVTSFADTSSDAPDARFQPKRNLYERMQQEGQGAAPETHDHDHSHEHHE